MRSIVRAVWTVGLAVTTLLAAGAVRAQTVTHGDFEITVMNGLGIVTSDDEDATVILTPVPPVWRFSIWSKSALTADLGFSFLSAHEGHDALTLVNLEGGMGFNLAPRDARLVPFVGALGGLLNAGSDTDSETNFYLGGQAGFRSFFRDYAAVRVQVGYRHVMLEYEDVGIIEIVGGLSFFL